ncbi:MAG: hypothetical protein NC041_05960 [Bacteroides sp.]|nr:hypothetical protein [Prevotella sp.]MCM1407501.1 hypothetical protein [Treponema brennaborense]MCM1469991.1 hypothetical protein [Bacteroides sp.]
MQHFASRQNSPFVHYGEFCEYMKRYAQRNIAEQPELLPFISDANDAVNKELAKLAEAKKAAVVFPDDADKKAIIPAGFFINRYTALYQEMETNPSIPFPLESDLPKNVPPEFFEKKQSTDYLPAAFENEPSADSFLYRIAFPHDFPTILLPTTIDMQFLLDISLTKIRLMLQKEEYHDYFLKKIRIANPSKELSAKNFFTQITTNQTETLNALKASGDTFYFWSQLCYFIRQDYQKVKDFTPEDISILQSVHIAEIAVSFYKNKTQQDLQRATALKNLELVLNKPPYYFDKNAIVKFVDSRGIPLLGQYSEEDLNSFLHEMITTLEDNNLPRLLVFKTEDDQRYFIYKSKIIPLIARLCTDAREAVRKEITKEWFDAYKNFETLPAMKDHALFEERLEQLVETTSPILHSLLCSNFLPLVYSETESEDAAAAVKLFANGKLLPYSHILLISHREIAMDAKILLPFWYTVPVISWLAALFFRKPRPKTKQEPQRHEKKSAENTAEEQEQNTFTQSSTASRKESLRNAALKAESQLVPQSSTIERELSSYERQWNKLLNAESQRNLTEDVNSLVRDYLRRVLRTIHGSAFTPERIKEIAEALVKTQSLQKIKDHDQLCMYIQLYLVKLVKNLK